MNSDQTKSFNVGTGAAAITDKPVFVIRARRGLRFIDFDAIWAYRGLLYFLVWRDVKVRYKQTIIGIGWAMFQPLMTAVVFTIVFWRFAGVESSGSPYQMFAFVGLLPWSYFSQALSRGATSLVGETNLISKVYFPRILVPVSTTLSPLVDFGFTLLALAGLMIWYRIAPGPGIVAIPFFLLLALATAFGVSLWLSALNARYRDVAHVVPFLIQLWMFASPIAYPMSSVPERWRWLYDLNPMVGVVAGFRWAVLGNADPEWTAVAISVVVVALLVWSGIVYFTQTERFLVDVL